MRLNTLTTLDQKKSKKKCLKDKYVGKFAHSSPDPERLLILLATLIDSCESSTFLGDIKYALKKGVFLYCSS